MKTLLSPIPQALLFGQRFVRQGDNTLNLTVSLH